MMGMKYQIFNGRVLQNNNFINIKKGIGMAAYTDVTPKYNKQNSLIGYSLVNDLEAVKNSLRNLFSISQGEVAGKPWLGNPLNVSLFDQIDYFTAYTLHKGIKNTVERFEPRVQIENLVVNSYPERNQIDIVLDYWVLINNEQIFDQTVISLSYNTLTLINLY
jgi:phage baseplate assembly protein W